MPVLLLPSLRRCSVECQIHADIAPLSVRWEFNGQELLQSDRIEISFSQDVGISHLTVHQVGPADSGDYACIVTGEIIEATSGERRPKTITSTSQVTIEG